MKLVQRIGLALILLLTTHTAYSQDAQDAAESNGVLGGAVGNEKFAVGIQLGNETSGLSAKYRATDKITGQVTLDFLGAITNYGVRGLYAFNTGPSYEIFGFASVALFRFDALFVDETTVGVGGGAGIEYDLRGLSPTAPPIFLAAELGVTLGGFDAFRGLSTFGLGLAAHYRF